MDRPSNKHQSSIDWSRVKGRLVYLPGGLIMLYGLWLSINL